MTVALASSRESLCREETARLQGVWVYVSGRWPARIHFSGEHFTIHLDSRGTYEGTFHADPTQNPGALDLTIDDGPDPYRGLTARCIYNLDGDWLWWCPNEPGRSERLATFPLHGEGKFPTIVLRRELQ